MKAFCAGALFCLALSACGVKAPPIAPESVSRDERVLNCSPQDPKCDVTDPNYQPKKK